MIDELVERHPEPKPSLGMPTRLTSFALPNMRFQSALACEVQLDNTRGLALVAMDEGCQKVLELDPEKMWSALLKRAGSEFMRRSIKPLIIASQRVTSELPKSLPQPGRVIWVPFDLPSGSCFLGMGV